MPKDGKHQLSVDQHMMGDTRLHELSSLPASTICKMGDKVSMPRNNEGMVTTCLECLSPIPSCTNPGGFIPKGLRITSPDTL
jgi:hypothetical protein